MKRTAVIAGLIAAACPAAAKDLSLGFPLDCQLGETCRISAFVDADGGPGAADFSCGMLSFDGHSGTDFSLTGSPPQQHRVNVLAAAPGRVFEVSDSATDGGTECATQVTLDHGGGWQTRYCGFAPATITVSPGRRVGMGTILGQIGTFGPDRTDLHFEVWKDGRVQDPFNADGFVTCDPAPARTLWQNPPGLPASG